MYGDPNQRKSLDFIYINYKKFGRYKIWDKIDAQSFLAQIWKSAQIF